MLGAFTELSRLCGQMDVKFLSEEQRKARERLGQAIFRAMPYNARAKAIEGQFSNLTNHYVAMLPAWVGGNRIVAKSQCQGQKMPPVEFEKLHEVLDTLLAYYHTTPQRGHLDGKSPKQAMEEAIRAGFRPIRVDEAALLFAFADTYDSKPVRAGRIVVRGRHYYSDQLLAIEGKVTVRVARHDPRFAFVFRDGKLLCVAKEDPVFELTDPAGAKEASRRRRALRRAIAGKRRQVARLDLIQEIQRVIDQEGKLEVPEGGTIRLPKEAEAMRKKLEEELQKKLECRDEGPKLKLWEADNFDPDLRALFPD